MAISVEDYIEFDLEAEFRHEYYRGHVTAMPAATYGYALIAGNVMYGLWEPLRDRPCVVLPNQLRLAAALNAHYTIRM